MIKKFPFIVLNLFVSLVIYSKDNPKLPNFIIILCDDLGYGDIGVYGHPTISTPNIDRLAEEGLKWTSFYTASSVSTPSRAGLLTGRLPVRSGMCYEGPPRVLTENSQGGLPNEEITIASLLKGKNYKTACIGKWHLGHLPQFLPTNHGFDYYYGIPYGNGMGRMIKDGERINNIPIMRNTEEIERPADQSTLTKRYTEEAIKFLKKNKDKPFFLYLAHTMPHIPLHRSGKFENVSLRGLYGDVVEELDWSVGKVIRTLKELNLDENTLVIFTSDNGPWKTQKLNGGSTGILSGEKGATFEGGMRVPAIFWWPEKIQPGVIMKVGTTLDIFPTFCSLANIPIPKDRVYDGYDLTPVLSGKGNSGRDIVFYYRGTRIFALRKGPYKAHFITKAAYGENDEKMHDPPLLFNLEHDPTEEYNIASQYPEILSEIKQEIIKHRKTLIPVENQLTR